MKKYSLEFSVGIFMLIGLACLAYLTVKLGKMELFGNDGYTLTAGFSSVAGLKTGANVEMAGVPVGKVTGIRMDKNYRAVVTLLINKDVALSEDAMASVKTSGLIGDKYISMSSGGSEVMLANGDEITETEPAVDIEALISKYVFGGVQ
ncbi:outer membrane lipid asymmetry maintenance protein MlaD [Desulfovibrio sp. OttesenSCG-928-M14]|nr:outer membrane lipid asymmetry maintenance protein MlaD [Desulfovibrio sp. OttesenSCG-928-M14]MDL2290525.1 outer membrane lipid asymmetry maintenance protein MlaD [Desulfovibrio sp. OttesenSCG-928-F20]